MNCDMCCGYDLTDIFQVLDFGAVRDGVPEANRGRRIVVDHKGREIEDLESVPEVPAIAAA